MTHHALPAGRFANRRVFCKTKTPHKRGALAFVVIISFLLLFFLKFPHRVAQVVANFSPIARKRLCVFPKTFSERNGVGMPRRSRKQRNPRHSLRDSRHPFSDAEEPSPKLSADASDKTKNAVHSRVPLRKNIKPVQKLFRHSIIFLVF